LFSFLIQIKYKSLLPERFANLGEAEIQKLLEDKDSLNTKRSTKASIE
jgi:hypothetical protein